ncbi:hypothetical protein DFR24_1061 [Panacagrimonas perspica]|uniref:OB-fold protein n=1 Tax=Panacagrimonas perspica TaxID=381431 RepID=A0A4S3K4U0_9GAMM|nr:Zn-ribbon domain-containing OB-fold protein [Panacagrimonas perspica]TDU31684.1 hypothetical protein DFR24_1061 [Panacagrimonas perspica]THD03100.1 hypothetical protein B1810_10935 [Panacagrimonas perspica]
MSWFADDMPRPVPHMDDAAFWEGCAERRLLFQHCAGCSTARHPPTPICPVCRSSATQWREAPAHAEVYTYTVIHYAAHAAVKDRLPYVAAVVSFAGLSGVRLVTNLTDCDPGRVRIGMPVRLWWDDIGDGQYLPRFAPLEREASS